MTDKVKIIKILKGDNMASKESYDGSRQDAGIEGKTDVVDPTAAMNKCPMCKGEMDRSAEHKGTYRRRCVNCGFIQFEPAVR